MENDVNSLINKSIHHLKEAEFIIENKEHVDNIINLHSLKINELEKCIRNIRDKAIIYELKIGTCNKAIAFKYNLSLARISQIKKQYKK